MAEMDGRRSGPPRISLERGSRGAGRGKAFPRGRGGCAFPLCLDGVQELQVKGAHEPFVLFRGDEFRRSGHGEKMPAEPRSRLARAYWIKVLIDNLERLGELLGVVRHQLGRASLTRFRRMVFQALKRYPQTGRFRGGPWLYIQGPELVPRGGPLDVEGLEALEILRTLHRFHARGIGSHNRS